MKEELKAKIVKKIGSIDGSSLISKLEALGAKDDDIQLDEHGVSVPIALVENIGIFQQELSTLSKNGRTFTITIVADRIQIDIDRMDLSLLTTSSPWTRLGHRSQNTNLPEKKSASSWFEGPRYTNPDFYVYNNELYHRPPNNLPLKHYLSMLQPSNYLLTKLGSHAHFIDTAHIPLEFIPHGRLGDGLKRDEMFARQAKLCLDHLTINDGLGNTLFINYTGRGSPVASMLYEHGIDCVWQLHEEHLGERTIQQFHDWINRSDPEKTKLIKSSFGIILEPNHGNSKIDTNHLPPPHVLNDIGIKKIIILTEHLFNANKLNYEFDPVDFMGDHEFALYISKLSKKYSIQIMGTDKPAEIELESGHNDVSSTKSPITSELKKSIPDDKPKTHEKKPAASSLWASLFAMCCRDDSALEGSSARSVKKKK